VSHPAGVADRLAAHALGLPDADPDGALAAHLAAGCDSCAVELRELRETGALLALGVSPVEPPSGLREQILDRVSGEGFVFVLAGAGAWEEDGNLERKQLYSVPGQGSTWLLSLRSGTWLEDAYRPGHLGYVVLRGELDGEGMRLGPGDFVPAAGKVPGRKMAVVMDTVLLAIAGSDQAVPLDSPRAVRAGKAAWNPMEPGATALAVAGSAAEAVEISLLRLDAGGSITRHRHDWVEELCVISGDCRCQGLELGPEDYHRASPGTRHDVTTSVTGCTLACIIRK